MAVRAVRGAVQLDRDEAEHLLDSVEELLVEMLKANELSLDELISVLFTSTPDLVSEFPAVAARRLGMGDVPLMCAQELAIAGSLPRVVRVLAHIETPKSRQELRHVYLRGAVALRRDIAQ
ncbi:chorismate mutase [Motilibacter rhizosphaerae]|uniref:chorismate mutase n=1 Tax=Motilibacter rhizosphaerae TaxID=598652 RepID=A0A4Q7NB70_9ACTN|nr:chorismate mutase [Motilibacter rhizosphaerae]RZS80218.1 chorismate mutase [Motilibacter rhizosphaerae]